MNYAKGTDEFLNNEYVSSYENEKRNLSQFDS